VARLSLARAGCEVPVEVVDPTDPDRAARVAAVSPTNQLPVLIEHGTTIWEPLAILEWAAERAPALWPAHARRRAVARCVVVEAQIGFAALRRELPFDWFARHRLRSELPAALKVDLHRLTALWHGLLDPDAAGFLFGPRPGLADFALVPLVSRLASYELWPREPAAADFAERLLALPELGTLLEPWPAEPALDQPPTLVAARRDRPAPATEAAPPAVAASAGTPRPTPASAPAKAPPRPRETERHEPIAGSLKLEEVVARARQRDRKPAPSAATSAPQPVLEPPPPSPVGAPRAEAPFERRGEPAGSSGQPPTASSHQSSASGAEPATEDAGADRPTRFGLSWPWREAAARPPGGGRRRRPPGRA